MGLEAGGGGVQRRIVTKALDGQRYPLTLHDYLWMCEEVRGSGPKGANNLCLESFERRGHNISLEAVI